MGNSTALEYTYRYPYASHLGALSEGLGLHLATCDGRQAHPHFFDGKLRHPRETALLLLVLSRIVATHFFLPRPVLRDPVVTSSESMLRFEGFSGCCGVYARVDLPPESFEREFQGRGTTNVDFNNPMRNALARLRESDEVRLAVGRDAVVLEKAGESVVEKKVQLPLRWVKGFSEVQLCQPKLALKVEVSGAEARRFLQGLPANTPKRDCFAVQTGSALRLTQREAPGAVRFQGTHRVKALEGLGPVIRLLRIWSDDSTAVSAWEAVLERGRLFLLISPEVFRGFSGEGQALNSLASEEWHGALKRVQASLKWQNQLEASKLAAQLKLSESEVAAALTALGARGLAGYDVNLGGYFHRELPFDMGLVEQHQPRLKGARKLLENGQVKVLAVLEDGGADVEVAGTTVAHFVRLRSEGDKCTCPWYSRNQGQRGPCKHVLAARMLVDGEA
jgi:hypothetical protein